MKIPTGDLTALQVETLWGRDRRELLVCGKRHDALTQYYLTRDARLRH